MGAAVLESDVGSLEEHPDWTDCRTVTNQLENFIFLK